MKVLHRILVVVLWIVLSVGISGWFVVTEAIGRSPGQPNPVSHQTVAYNNHGHTVFITQVQSEVLAWFPVVNLFVVGCGILLRMWKPVAPTPRV